MTWKGFFEGIESFFVDTVFWPYDVLRDLADESWALSNIVSWVLIAIGICGFFYWMSLLYKYNVAGDEDRSITSHSYLS